MRGIAGIVDVTGGAISSQMFDALRRAGAYRGTDAIDEWHGLGASLVAFVSYDVPEAIGQPHALVDAATGTVIVVAGRVDNRNDLKAAASSTLTHTIGSEVEPSDAQLVAAAHLHWGAESVSRVIGDFAYAAWDPRARTLIAGRDPMAMRPLFYHWDGRRLVFASDIGAVLAALGEGHERSLDDLAVVAFLTNTPRGPRRTPFRSVTRLEAGHSLTASKRGLHVSRRWRFDPTARPREGRPEAYTERFRDVFREAVRCRMRSNGPVAVTLSGGVDSGSIVTMAAILAQNGSISAPPITYSWAFEELLEVDERTRSAVLVDHFGLEAHDVPADDRWPLCDYPSRDPVLDDLTLLPFEPVLHSMLKSARAAAVRRVLIGTRGDAIVGEAVLDTLGLVLNGRLGAAAREVGAYRHHYRSSLLRTSWRLLVRPAMDSVLAAASLRPDIGHRLAGRASIDGDVPPWLTQRHHATRQAAVEEEASRVREHGFRGPRARRFEAVTAPYSERVVEWSEHLHAKMGLDTADPWSDRRVAETILDTPAWLVQRIAEPKVIVRQAMRGLMPEAFHTHMRKTSPYPLYRRGIADRARSTIFNLFDNPVSADLGYVEPGPLRQHLDDVRDGAPERPATWSAIALEMWLRTHGA